jgi:hypothetical protein
MRTPWKGVGYVGTAGHSARVFEMDKANTVPVFSGASLAPNLPQYVTFVRDSTGADPLGRVLGRSGFCRLLFFHERKISEKHVEYPFIGPREHGRG